MKEKFSRIPDLKELDDENVSDFRMSMKTSNGMTGRRQPETKPTSRNKILPCRDISPASEDAQKANSGVDQEGTDPLCMNTMQTQAHH